MDRGLRTSLFEPHTQASPASPCPQGWTRRAAGGCLETPLPSLTLPGSGPLLGEAGGSKQSSPPNVLRTYVPLAGSPEIWYTYWADAQTPLRVLERAAVRNGNPVRSGPSGRGRPCAALRIFVQGGGGGGRARRSRRWGRFSRSWGHWGWNRISRRDCHTGLLSGVNLGGGGFCLSASSIHISREQAAGGTRRDTILHANFT